MEDVDDCVVVLKKQTKKTLFLFSVSPFAPFSVFVSGLFIN